jgi:SH3 domain protein
VKKLLILLILLLACTFAHAARTVYVVDEIVITLRSGQGTQYQILRTIPTGTPLELLESNEETGYSKVRMKNGTEGWVLTQYLTETPTHKARLAVAEKNIKNLKTENKTLKDELEKSRSAKNVLQKDWDNLSVENEKMKKELNRIRDISEQPLRLADENKKLQAENLANERNLQMLTQENQALKDRSDRDWFLTGAAVLILGLLIGFILPKIHRSKKSGWDSL